jgi:hypothetical protein
MNAIRIAGLCLLRRRSSAALARAHRRAAWTAGYTLAEVDIIMDRRANGDGLDDVMRVVRGSRREVKHAEAAERVRHRTGLALPMGAVALALAHP